MKESIERASIDARQYEHELERIEQTRILVTRLLDAETGRIAFTGRRPSGLNTVANGLDWKPGDEVYAISMIIRRTFIRARAGATGSEASAAGDGAHRGNHAGNRRARADEADKTRGASERQLLQRFRIDLDAIGALCAERGVLFSVDAIQNPGRFSGPVEAHRSSAPARKMDARPIGSWNSLHKKSRHDLLRPPIIGGWNVVCRISSRNAK